MQKGTEIQGGHQLPWKIFSESASDIFSCNFATMLDDSQITHLISVRLKMLLYDFFLGGGGAG